MSEREGSRMIESEVMELALLRHCVRITEGLSCNELAGTIFAWVWLSGVVSKSDNERNACNDWHDHVSWGFL